MKNVSLNDVQKVLAFCRDNNVDTDAVLKSPIMFDLILASSAKDDKVQQDSATDNKPDSAKPTKLATKKVNASLVSAKLPNKRYPIYGRVSVTTTGDLEFKAVVKGVDMEKIGRERYPYIEVSDSKYQDIFRLVRKMYLNDKALFTVHSHGNRATYDTKLPVADADVMWDNVSIKSISKIGLRTDPIYRKKNGVGDPRRLEVWELVLDKSDPVLLDDMVLKASRYSENLKVEFYSKEIVGRVGEIAFSLKHPQWVWNNKRAEIADGYDFSRGNLTLDLKSTKNLDGNLLIQDRKVESGTLADFLALCFIKESENNIVVQCMGFCTKHDALNYIKAHPFRLMPDNNWKIVREFLLKEIVAE